MSGTLYLTVLNALERPPEEAPPGVPPAQPAVRGVSVSVVVKIDLELPVEEELECAVPGICTSGMWRGVVSALESTVPAVATPPLLLLPLAGRGFVAVVDFAGTTVEVCATVRAQIITITIIKESTNKINNI